MLERRVVTALFADLAGFTTLGESLDPEDLRAVQDAYFGAARETIERYGGVLEKFIGDAVVALFGIPRTRDDDAERAVRAGLAFVGAVEQLGATVGLEPRALRVRVGVNTGEVLAGEEGPERGAATGDTVNVAARLQAAAAPGTVLVGEETALAVAAGIELGAPQELELKGKSGLVRARRALSPRPEPSREQAMGSLHAPLLGRVDELTALAAARGRWVVVAPPGSGKTRLVEEFARGLDVCRARLRPETRAPQAAVAQLLLSTLPLEARNDAFLRKRLLAAGASPARAAVVVRELGAVAWPGQDASGDRDREALFAAWTEGLGALGPELWIVEDVHWAGADLLAFLDYAGRAGRVVLTTARPALLEREPAWCESAQVMHLPPLPAAEVGELVHALIGDALPEELVERIVERAGGNPLFVEELLRSWIGAGALVPGGGRWRLTVEESAVALPTTVQAIYAAQIDDLPETARTVTRNASVAGRRFPARGLPALGVEDGAEGVDVLVRRALVSGPHADPLGDSFAFRHALLRDAAYAGLARRDRAQLHVSFARWIEQAAGAHLDELSESIGRHYAAAVENAPALAPTVAEGLDRRHAANLAAQWLERAAETALDGAAHETARELLRGSLELTADEAVLDRSRRLRLLGEATSVAADLDEAEQTLASALDLARAAFRHGGAGARDAYALAAAAVTRVQHEQLRFHEELELVEETLAELGSPEDAATARLLLRRASAYDGVGAPNELQLADIERALELARAHGDAKLEFDASIRHTFQLLDVGEAGADACAQVVRAAVEQGAWRDAVRALSVQAAVLTESGNVEEALALLGESGTLAEAHGLTEHLVWNDYSLVEVGLVSGDWDTAIAAGQAAVELGERNGYHRATIRSWFALLPIAGARGDFELLSKARNWFGAQGLSSVDAAALSPFAHLMACGVERVLARAGLGDEPSPQLEVLLPELDYFEGMPSWLAAMDEVFRLWAEQGDHDKLRAALDRREATRKKNAASFGIGLDELGFARLDRDAVRAREALRRFRELRGPWWQAKALRVLESLGEEGAGAEAASIERGLGIPAAG